MKFAASLTLATALLASPKLADGHRSEDPGATEFPAAMRLLPGAPARVELTNTGTQPITAWSFTVSTPTANGVHRENHTADVYLSEVTGQLPGAEPHLDRIMPGQSRTLPIDAANADASVQITALVLQDGTGLGDPDALKTFFDHRASERDQLKVVANTFRAVLAAKRGSAALVELEQQLKLSGSEGSVPHRAARDAVEVLLRKARAGNEEEADHSARTYAELVSRQYDAAVSHAHRKQ